MADKKPLRISDDPNDLQSVEFGDGDQLDVDGVINVNGDLTFEDLNAGGPYTLTEILDSGGAGSGYIKFGSNSTSGTGKWLEIHRNIVSNEVPYNVPAPIEIVSLTVTVKNSTTVTFGIYKNGIQIDTLVVTAAKKAIKTGLTHSLVANDELSAKVESGSASDPVLHIILG